VRIRCFLAIELSENLKRSLESLRSRVDLPQFDVRWVEPRNLHLTLRFLGEIPEEDIETVSEAAQKTAEATESFSLLIQGLGAFPTLGSPRVVWAGVEPAEPVVRLERKLSRELDRLNWPPPDKPFRPHLTIGRVKSSRGKGELRRLLERTQREKIGEIRVTDIGLIRSQLRPAGPLYTNLKRFTFARQAGNGEA